jgi:hypothetical protein
MKAWATLISAAALAALAGCNQAGGNASNSASNAAANATDGKDGAGNSAAADAGTATPGGKDPAGATPASSGAINLDRTFLIGRWSDTGDCRGDVITFNQDGSFLAANGGGGLWNLDGDRLTMTGRATATVRVAPIDQDTMTVINADGSLGRSTRC